ncbi:MAG TPA: NUDIX hydrolase [Candidatus Microsaccharimonas sp.]|nr:NUDIX hydrolase [Candidatus Microsaccharimonas sp.]
MALIKTARAILLNPERQVLLARRPWTSKSRPGQLDFFGGRSNGGESSVQTAIRETLEESAIDLTGAKLEQVYRVIERDGPNQYLREYFRAIIPEFPTATLTEHVSQLILPGLVAVEELSFAPHRNALTNALGA